MAIKNPQLPPCSLLHIRYQQLLINVTDMKLETTVAVKQDRTD